MKCVTKFKGILPQEHTSQNISSSWLDHLLPTDYLDRVVSLGIPYVYNDTPKADSECSPKKGIYFLIYHGNTRSLEADLPCSDYTFPSGIQIKNVHSS